MAEQKFDAAPEAEPQHIDASETVNAEGRGGVLDLAAQGDITFDAEAESEAPIAPEGDCEALQHRLEARMRGLAAARGARRLAAAEARGAEAERGPGAKAVAEALERLAAAIRADRAEVGGRRAGRAPEAVKETLTLEPETVAYLSLRGMLDRLSQRPTVSAAAMRIGALIEEEIVAREAARRSPAAARRAATGGPGRLRAQTRRLGLERWSQRRRHLVGARLLQLGLEATDWAEIDALPEPPAGDGARRPAKRLIATERAAAARAAAYAGAAWAAPIYEPMAVAPRPWAGFEGGGYLGRAARPLALVKSGAPSGIAARLTPETAPVAFEAINRAQATAWAVNARVLAVLEAIAEDSTLCPEAPLPAAEPAPRPSQDAPKAERWAWGEAERRRRSRRIAFERMLAQAKRHRLLEAFYLPCQFDFRGRLYAVTELSPQGPDAMKALLRFARAKPLGSEGWKWLAIHLCNCGDFSKMSKAPLAARAEWTLAHEERILTVAADPLADLWWLEADEPWQFLAACFEWEGYCAEGEAFLSHLPIGLDGSCSGIQHFSLALRDEVGGAAVNLTPQAPEARAADIYEEVAAAVRALLERDLTREETFGVGGEARRPVAALARAWLDFGVTRALCKRPTMTYGYGARGYGYVEQIMADTLGPAFAAHEADPERPWPFEGRGFGEALYLAARMTEAIERTVLKAAEAMRWLQQVASAATARGRPLLWTAPDGFPVLQAYREQRDLRVKTVLAGRPLRLTLKEETARLDARRQRQGVAPNFVHALDACHLRLTVARAAEEGMRDFALVHDSFAVHAADTPRFFQIIRETMVEMYDAVDVMGAFHEEIAAQLAEEGAAPPPAPPPRGRLELRRVLDSEHCFS
ncbi:MAG: DNA-directed RNA polymerase [Pseudomonadota bacterium]